MDSPLFLTAHHPPVDLSAPSLTTWFAGLEPERRELRSPGTWRAYATDLAHFADWCEQNDRTALPADPATVADYLTAQAGQFTVATLSRRLAAISVAHRVMGVPSPTGDDVVAVVWRTLRRSPDAPRPRQVDALETRALATLVAPLRDTVMDHRDRALLVLGFAGALRRSEVSALDVADVEVAPDHLTVLVRAVASRESRTVVLPYGNRRDTCPVRSWRDWTTAARITEGPAFRRMTKGGRSLRPERLGDRGVAEVVKRRALDAGLDPRTLAGHSLRAGFVTAATRAGVPGVSIARQTGHRSAAALAACVREDRAFAQNAAEHVGL